MAINVSDAIRDALLDYSEEVVNATNGALKEVAKEAATELKSAGGFKDRTGKYRKGWTVKEEGGTLGINNQIVHNAKHYQLTHLLEYGHASRNGGRTRAYPHIASVEEGLGEKIEAKMREKLG